MLDNLSPVGRPSVQRDVDLTVHSSKDVPIDLNESVIQVALLERAPAFDLLLFPAKHEHLPSLEETLRDAETKVDAGDAFSHLAEGAHVGTVSVRRQASLLHQPSGCLAHRDSRRGGHTHATAQRRACRRAAAGRSGVAPSARPRCTRCGAPPTSGAQAEPRVMAVRTRSRGHRRACRSRFLARPRGPCAVLLDDATTSTAVREERRILAELGRRVSFSLWRLLLTKERKRGRRITKLADQCGAPTLSRPRRWEGPAQAFVPPSWSQETRPMVKRVHFASSPPPPQAA